MMMPNVPGIGRGSPVEVSSSTAARHTDRRVECASGILMALEHRKVEKRKPPYVPRKRMGVSSQDRNTRIKSGSSLRHLE